MNSVATSFDLLMATIVHHRLYTHTHSMFVEFLFCITLANVFRDWPKIQSKFIGLYHFTELHFGRRFFLVFILH